MNTERLRNAGAMLAKAARYAVQHPLGFIVKIAALLRGCWYAVYFFALSRGSVTIKLPLLAYDTLSITGPGRVTIGRNCSIYKNTFSGLRIVTLSPEAGVSIGKNCALGGITIRCRRNVEIGEKSITAYSLVQDALFAEPGNVRNKFDVTDLVSAGTVYIGSNVWLGGQAIILDQTVIQKDSVVSWGAVCRKQEVGEYSLAFGNPIMKPYSITQIMKFQR